MQLPDNRWVFDINVLRHISNKFRAEEDNTNVFTKDVINICNYTSWNWKTNQLSFKTRELLDRKIKLRRMKHENKSSPFDCVHFNKLEICDRTSVSSIYNVIFTCTREKSINTWIHQKSYLTKAILYYVRKKKKSWALFA